MPEGIELSTAQFCNSVLQGTPFPRTYLLHITAAKKPKESFQKTIKKTNKKSELMLMRRATASV